MNTFMIFTFLGLVVRFKIEALDHSKHYLFLQEVHLVEEEYEGDPGEAGKVDERLEHVDGLSHPVGLVVLEQPLVELGSGGEEEDGGDRVEDLKQ